MSSSQSLGQSLARIERHLNKLWRADEEATAFQQTSFNEYDYVHAVEELGTPRLSDLADTLCVSKPSTSNMVSKLEKKGLLERIPCPQDRRSVLVKLTREGKKLMALDDRLFNKLTEKVEHALSPGDFKTLERLLTSVCNQL